MRIGMVGTYSRDKSYLMMYLGKLLSQGMKVCIITREQWFMPELDTYVINDNLVITGASSKGIDADIHLLDVAGSYHENLDKAVFVSGTDRQSVEENELLFNEHAMVEESRYLFMNVLMDSKINEKYLFTRFGLDTERDSILYQYLDDGDMAVNIENGYNDCLELRGLSKAYKKMLLALAEFSCSEEPRSLKRWLRWAERSR